MQILIDITEHEWEYLNKLAENGDQLGHYERMLVNGDVLEQEPKTEWIPVSERLPEESGNYLTYIVNPYVENLQYSMTCYYCAKFNSWSPDDEIASDNVIAWMPLPEPYKAESEG